MFTAIGSGLLGSIVFYVANLFFGGSSESAYQASFVGFWVFLIIAFFSTRKTE
jgi:hypothetical protein